MIIDVEEDYLKWQHSDGKINKADFSDLIEAYEKMQNLKNNKCPKGVTMICNHCCQRKCCEFSTYQKEE